MNISNVITSVFLLLSYYYPLNESIYAQSQDSVIKAHELNSSYFDSKNVISYSIGFTSLDASNGSNAYRILDSSNNLIVTVKTYYNSKYVDNHIKQDYINLKGKRYKLDSLLFHSCPDCTIPFHGELEQCLMIKTNKKCYLGLFLNNFDINSNSGDLGVFLIQIRPEIHVISLGYSIYNPTKMFFDLNNDGNIEYISLSKDGDTINLKEVIGKHIIKTGKFLKINNLDGDGQSFTIDKEKSIWLK